MKKNYLIFVLLIILVLSLSLVACDDKTETSKSLASKAANESVELKLAHITDTHYFSPTLIGDYTYSSFDDSEMSDAKTFEISNAIIRSAFDEMLASKFDAAVITGDVCDNHATQNHTEMAALLKEYEDKGLKIFVVPGNHDVAESGYYGYRYTESGKERVDSLHYLADGTAVDRITNFKEIYNEFGYSEAIATFGLSYVADIKSGYRLLCIDNCSENLSDETLIFVKAQCEKAKADNVKLIACQHKPINNIFYDITEGLIPGLIDENRAITAKSEELKETLAGNASVLLSGHNHCNDSVILEAKNGKKLVEMMTVSLIQNTNCYRSLEFTKNYLKGEVKRVSGVKESYLPAYLTAEDKTAILTDFEGYSMDRIEKNISNIVTELGLKNKILTFLFGSEIPTGAEAEINKIVEFLDAPLYGENSFEALYLDYGVNFVKSDYNNLYEVMANVASKVFDGEENLKDTVELKILKTAVKGILAKIYESNLIQLMGLNKTISNEVFCKELLSNGKFELKDSNFLNIIIKAEATQKFLNDDSSAAKIVGNILPDTRTHQITTAEEFNQTVKNIGVYSKLIAKIINVNLISYFEKEAEEVYSGIFYWDSFIDDAIINILPTFIEDKDLADKNFVIELSTQKWEKTKSN